MTTRSIPPHSLATPGERTILAIPLPGVFGHRMSCPRWRAEPAGAGRRGGAGAARRLGAAHASATRRNRARQLSLRGRRAKLPALAPSGGRCGLAPRLLPLPPRPAAGPFPVGEHGRRLQRRIGGARAEAWEPGGFPRLLSRGAGWCHHSRWRSTRRAVLGVVRERSPYSVIGRTGPKGRDAAIHTRSVTVRSAAKARPGNRPPPCHCEQQTAGRRRGNPPSTLSWRGSRVAADAAISGGWAVGR